MRKYLKPIFYTMLIILLIIQIKLFASDSMFKDYFKDYRKPEVSSMTLNYKMVLEFIKKEISGNPGKIMIATDKNRTIDNVSLIFYYTKYEVIPNQLERLPEENITCINTKEQMTAYIKSQNAKHIIYYKDTATRKLFQKDYEKDTILLVSFDENMNSTVHYYSYDINEMEKEMERLGLYKEFNWYLKVRQNSVIL